VIPQYIYDLLLENDCVVVPGLGGFLCQYQSARLDRQRLSVTPPSRTIAFNRALQQNDGLLVQSVVIGDQISYKEAEEKVREFVAQCNHHLHQHGSVQLPRIGRLYTDHLKHIQFTPSSEALPLESSFGLPVLTAKPVVRLRDALPDIVEEEVEAQAEVVPMRRQRGWPYWIAASFAGIFIAGTLWINSGQTSINAAVEAGFFSSSATVKLSDQVQSVKMDNGQITTEYLAGITEKKLDMLSESAFATEDVAADEAIVSPAIYPVVVGAFKGPITATRYRDDLIARGYQAELLNPTGNAFYKVIINFQADDEATALRTIRDEVEKDAWLLTDN